MRSDRRKELAAQNGDHWAHPDAGVRELILEACADAWDEGHELLCDCFRCGHTNPYRQDQP